MGGGLIQLTNTGAQDIYLTGNPQITYFKIVYRRHTNFAMESIEQVNTGTIIPGGEIIFNIAIVHSFNVRLPCRPTVHYHYWIVSDLCFTKIFCFISEFRFFLNTQDFLIPGIDYFSRIWYNVMEFWVFNALQLCTCLAL